MTGTKGSIAGVAVGAALCAAVLVLGAMWALRPGPAVEYPADPTDQPPAAAAFDAGLLMAPGCPTEQPDEAPAVPGKAGDDKLVDWGAVQLVRCTYTLGPTTTYELERIDAIDDPNVVTDAVRVLRRMLTAAQFTEYFGPIGTWRNSAAFPTYRYLFQYPDGHVTEVDYRGGYYRDGIVRLRWSVRGTSVAPLEASGSRTCGPTQPRTCQITGTVAAIAI
jgi:hypothetical protein